MSPHPYLRFMALLDGDAEDPSQLAERTRRLLGFGVTCVQLRCKAQGAAQFLEHALTIAEVCRQGRVPLIINDRPDIALLCNASGVHLGPKDLPPTTVASMLTPGMHLGVSARTQETALSAQTAGATYIGCGAVRSTNTKREAQVIGMDGVRVVTASVDIPVVAIGGVQPRDVAPLLEAGVAGVAVLSPVMAPDPEALCKAFAKALV
jgi:thiamine-phosphate pyrophosphorylase